VAAVDSAGAFAGNAITQAIAARHSHSRAFHRMDMGFISNAPEDRYFRDEWLLLWTAGPPFRFVVLACSYPRKPPRPHTFYVKMPLMQNARQPLFAPVLSSHSYSRDREEKPFQLGCTAAGAKP
jgi:hypothetical protein